MAFNFKKFWDGIKLVPKTATTSDSKGDLEVLDSDSKIYYHNGTVNLPLLTDGGSATITNKTIVVSNNTVTTAASGNLSATELNAALAELDADITASAGASGAALAAHIADPTDAHAATAITNTPAGTIAAINVQAAINELDGDVGVVASDLAAHLADTVDAHDASAISNVPSGNLAATEVQAALNELQTDIDTRVTSSSTSVDNHVVRFDGTTGKIIQDGTSVVLSDASGLSGLTQLDVDNLRLDGNTISSTDANGNIILAPNGTGIVNVTKNSKFDALINFASTNDAATGANATLTSPTTKVIRLTNASLVSLDGIPGGTSARELIIENATGTTVVINEDTGATAANRFYTGTTTGINLADKASIYLSYDATQSRWRVIGGSGSGTSTDAGCFAQLDASELLSTWSTGDNATFLGGGTLSGTFVKETASPLNGTASYKYTQAAGSLDDYLASPVQSVPLRFRGNTNTFNFVYTYDGGSSDIAAIVYDVTNSTVLTSSTTLVPTTGTTVSTFVVNVTIPLTCTQVRVGFQTKILNSGKILQFDDLSICSNATLFADIANITDWQSYTPTYTGFGTVTDSLQWRRVGQNVEIKGKFTSGVPTATEARISLPNSYVSAGTTIIPSIQLVGKANHSGSATTDFSGRTILIESSVAYVTIGKETSTTAGITKQNADQFISNGQVLSFFASVPVAGLTASNPNILTAPDTFSTDTASLVYASSATYTLATLADAPIGTFITFTYAASTNTRTQTTTAPTQTTANMNTNGIQIFTRAYNAASTSASPAAVAIQLGKGLKGTSLDLYKSTTKVTTGSLDNNTNSGTAQSGFSFKEYNEATGILYLDAAYDSYTACTTRTFTYSDITLGTDGYVVINASKSPALVGIPQVQPRFATISDVKANTTNGGGFTSGAFSTRTLNTLVDNTGIVTSLASNQFTLSAGEYYIEASAPAYQVNRHTTKLRNITDSTDTLIGSSEIAHNTVNVTTRSFVSGSIILTSNKTFEIQHICQTTNSTSGFGLAGGVGVSEVYSIVKLTKVK